MQSAREERANDDVSGDASTAEDNDIEFEDNIYEIPASTKLTPLKFEAVNIESQMKMSEKLTKFENKAHCLLAGMTANSREFMELDIGD